MNHQSTSSPSAGSEEVQAMSVEASASRSKSQDRADEVQDPKPTRSSISLDEKARPQLESMSREEQPENEKYEPEMQETKRAGSDQNGNDEPRAIGFTEKPIAIEVPQKRDPQSLEPCSNVPTLSFRKSRRGRYVPVPDQKLRNNLSPMVGYLEFANATDFAANVWNTIPVPTFAAVLMGLGGATAIILSVFALMDGLLCWHNIRLLRKERAELLAMKGDEEKAESRLDGRDVSISLEVNRRELGQEIVDRLSMDAFMGFSSLVVGAGTLMAIGGANPHVYRASNLLSGYIGNSPSAFWGLANSLWSAYLFRRAGRHQVGMQGIQSGLVKAHLKKRTSSVRIHSVVMGLATFISAPAGLVTATHWQGYPPLIPCIILAKWGNVVFRRRIGYTRFPYWMSSPSTNPQDLVKELEWTIALKQAVQKISKADLMKIIENHDGEDSITAFMSRCGLLEELSGRLLNSSMIAHKDATNIDVDTAMVEYCERTTASFTSVAHLLFKQEGKRALAYKERYLLELLGSSLHDAAERRRQSISR